MMPGAPPPTAQEEITTIFVVGFPDDMAEREFQNMFVFCPGFEAASLKIPLTVEVEDAKKQIVTIEVIQIGFAKFRTIEDALQARDILSGRKIDLERGCALKAEMAKKNLHTKRGIINPDIHKIYTSFRRRSSVPDSVGADLAYFKQHSEFSDGFDQSTSDFYPQQAFTHQFIDNITNADMFDPFAPNPTILDADGIDQFDSPTTTEDFDSKLPPLFGSSKQSRGFSSVLYNSDAMLSKSLGSMSMVDVQNPEYTSCRSSSFSYSPPVHPGADQNPPCNTLYVGNLPNDSCEDELRRLFQCCPGYKRLSFKTRANGPMCFVEFENIHYATQALFQLYGNYLTNSTKGGIRLSYSKNPLGVRQQSLPPFLIVTELQLQSLA